MGFEMWFAFRFSWKIVVMVQSGLTLYDLTIIAVGVQMKESVY